MNFSLLSKIIILLAILVVVNFFPYFFKKSSTVDSSTINSNTGSILKSEIIEKNKTLYNYLITAQMDLKDIFGRAEGFHGRIEIEDKNISKYFSGMTMSSSKGNGNNIIFNPYKHEIEWIYTNDFKSNIIIFDAISKTDKNNSFKISLLDNNKFINKDFPSNVVKTLIENRCNYYNTNKKLVLGHYYKEAINDKDALFTLMSEMRDDNIPYYYCLLTYSDKNGVVVTENVVDELLFKSYAEFKELKDKDNFCQTLPNSEFKFNDIVKEIPESDIEYMGLREISINSTLYRKNDNMFIKVPKKEINRIKIIYAISNGDNCLITDTYNDIYLYKTSLNTIIQRINQVDLTNIY